VRYLTTEKLFGPDDPLFPKTAIRQDEHRDTLTQLAYKLKLNPEQLKAWSQNMGHESPLTTLGSYGPVSIERQAEIMSSVGQSDIAAGDIETRIAEKVAAILKG